MNEENSYIVYLFIYLFIVIDLKYIDRSIYDKFSNHDKEFSSRTAERLEEKNQGRIIRIHYRITFEI